MDKVLLHPRALTKLRKVAALFDSPNEGERASARNRATAMVSPHGWTFNDIPSLLHGTAKISSSTAREYINPFAGFEDFMERTEPGYKAKQARARAERKRAEAIARAELIKRYGSADAVLRPDAYEAAVNAAAAPFVQIIDEGGGWKYETLAGWPGNGSIEELPGHVATALEANPRFPTTLTEAKAEHEYWLRRIGERKLVDFDLREYYLSEACEARYQLIYKALMTDLRAQSIAEAIIRQKEIMDADFHEEDAERALLADLEFLADRERALVEAPTTSPLDQSVQFGHSRTATDRRADVMSRLSNLDASKLSDREIARQVGVSPQTVGNIRRRMAPQRKARASEGQSAWQFPKREKPPTRSG